MKRTMIGGQALIEGVMMKNLDRYSTAVRKPDGTIDVQVTHYESFTEKHHLNHIPIIRGIFNFLESMVIGVKTLTYSSSFYDDDGEALSDEQREENLKKKQEEEKEKGKAWENLMMAGAIIFSLAFSLAIFLVLPNLITNFIRRYTDSELIFAAVEGVIRVAIFVLYVALIACMNDIKRVFMYHGAEHKTINCLEHGIELTPENVLTQSRYHKRCGTSFMIIVMIISIFFFMFIDSKNKVIRILLRLLLVPVIGGVSYELIRYAGKHDNLFVRIISKPGFWIQKLTTREPDASMAEVAIKSVEAVMDWRAYQEAMRRGEIED